jgi:hypothetical protein
LTRRPPGSLQAVLATITEDGVPRNNLGDVDPHPDRQLRGVFWLRVGHYGATLPDGVGERGSADDGHRDVRSSPIMSRR